MQRTVKLSLIVFFVNMVIWGSDVFVVDKGYAHTKFASVTIGVLPIKKSKGEPDGLSSAIQQNIIRELKKEKAFTEARSFNLPSESLTVVAVAKLEYEKELRSYVPGHAKVMADGYCPDLILFVKRSEIKNEQKSVTLSSYNPAIPGIKNGREFNYSRTKVETRYFVWDNKNGAVVGAGEAKGREYSQATTIDSGEVQDIAGEIAKKIVGNIKLTILKESP
jgi:hypothetical protein